MVTYKLNRLKELNSLPLTFGVPEESMLGIMLMTWVMCVTPRSYHPYYQGVINGN